VRRAPIWIRQSLLAVFPLMGFSKPAADYWRGMDFATAEVLYGPEDFVASRLDQPQKRLFFNRFSLPCTSVYIPGA
jgi:hypothetical protein